MHSHSHKHNHKHEHKHQAKNVLLITLILAFSFAAIEAVAGWWSNSLALLSDAGHMATDTLSLVLATFAAWVATKPPSEQHTYGLGRAEVLGAWVSSIIIVVVAIIISVEAIERIRHTQSVSAPWVMAVGGLGILMNLGMVWMLSHGEKTLNVRAAILHIFGDLLGSVAAFISGVVIYFTGWLPIDPILSLFICLLILISSFRLLRETVLVLMEGVPLHLNLAEVGRAMAKAHYVIAVHDLHIWTLSSGVVVLSAHVEIEKLNEWEKILTELKELLLKQYGIGHVTLQPESHTQILQRVPRKEG
jgi:cobalt-zinc-cadmium efflux system protein